MRRAARVLRVTASTIFVAVWIGLLALILVPRALGWHGVIVLSGSMEPELATGGVAFVDRIQPSEIRRGDVITFANPFSPDVEVTHRVTEASRDDKGYFFRTRGDANDEADTWTVRPEHLVGKVRLDLPYLGYVAERLADRTGFLLLMGVPAALIVAGEMKSIADELRKAMAEREAARAPARRPRPLRARP